MELKSIVEALLLASEKPLTVKGIQAALKGAAEFSPRPETEQWQGVREGEIRESIAVLQEDYRRNGQSFQILEVADGFQLGTRTDFVDWVRHLFEETKPNRLSQPALETLAIIAYRQPISRADIEAVRGVAVDGVMATLLERRLIKIAGRAEVPGRPLIYETTHEFLEYFGLKNLDELPNADELRRIEIKRAEAAVPAQPELIHETGTPAGADRPAGPATAETAEPAN
jgi:segregation and condensation protein B